MANGITIKRLSLLSVLIAIEIVLSRFLSIHTWNLKIGFSFVPVVIAAALFGALEAGLVAAIGDVVGALLVPTGAFFPGFTVTAFLTGVIYAVFLKKNISIVRIVIAVLIVQFAGSLILNSFWISVLYGSPFWPLFYIRIYQAAVMGIIQIVTMLVMGSTVIPALRREI